MADCLECSFFKDDYNDNVFCILGNLIDDNYKACKDFKLHRSCMTCEHSIITVYELGEIDSIDYKCKLQNNKLIYSDNDPCKHHNFEIPECNIGQYQSTV